MHLHDCHRNSSSFCVQVHILPPPQSLGKVEIFSQHPLDIFRRGAVPIPLPDPGSAKPSTSRAFQHMVNALGSINADRMSSRADLQGSVESLGVQDDRGRVLLKQSLGLAFQLPIQRGKESENLDRAIEREEDSRPSHNTPFFESVGFESGRYWNRSTRHARMLIYHA